MSVMVTITKQQVPAYLVGSDFYNSLSADNDEEFSIPKQYFKPTTSISSAEELSHFMKTINFWGLKKLPDEIIELLVFKTTEFPETERTKICKVLLELDVEFDLLDLYLNVPVSTSRKQRFDAAIRFGREYVLNYVYSVDKQGVPALVQAAAQNGHLQLLQQIVQDQSHASSCPCLHVSLSLIAAGGHVRCLQYLLDKGCTMDQKAIIAAAKSGHLACLRLARERGYVFDRDILFAASLHGHLECLEYVLQHGCAATSHAASYAAVGGQVECLQYLLDQGAPLAKHICNSAATGGSVECLKLLRARGCPWDKVCPKIAASRGNLACLKYLISQGTSVGKFTAHAAAENGKHFCLEFLLAHGCMVGNETVHVAAKRGHIRCLHILKRFKVPLDMDAVLGAINIIAGRRICSNEYAYLRTLIRAGYVLPSQAATCMTECGDIPCLELICAKQCCELTTSLASTAASKPKGGKMLEVLYRHRCPWDVATCISAASAESVVALAFAHTHGCPWDERVSEAAASNGNMAVLRYCVEHGCPISRLAMNAYNTDRGPHGNK